MFATLAKPVYEISGAHRMTLLLAVPYKIDMRHDDDICFTKADGELFHQKSCSTVLMRLKDADQTLWLMVTAQGAQGGVDLGRMMAIVVHHRNAMG